MGRTVRTRFLTIILFFAVIFVVIFLMIILLFVVVVIIFFFAIFLVCGQSLSIAEEQLNTLCRAFEDMGIPLAPEKIVGPATRIPYLGIGIDSVEMMMFITDEKYDELIDMLQYAESSRMMRPKWDLSYGTCYP